MDPLAARLSKLSVSNRSKKSKQPRGGRRAPPSGVQSVASGLRTPASGLRPASGQATPSSSISTPGTASTYGSEIDSDEDEEDDEDQEDTRQPFRFFDLPYELRRKILQLVMTFKVPVDLDLKVNAAWRTRMMPASRQFYEECSEAFYGSNMFRLLPLDGPVLKKRTRPLLQAFSPRNRARITRIELRLGPHWENPPRCWQIDDKLGLESLTSLRRLDIIVQTDPEHPSFAGFRKSKEFYTHFCGNLLSEIIQRLPKLETVYIDSWPSVGRDSPLLRKLEKETKTGGKKLIWSSRLHADDCYSVVSQSRGPSLYDTVIIREMIFTDI